MPGAGSPLRVLSSCGYRLIHGLPCGVCECCGECRRAGVPDLLRDVVARPRPVGGEALELSGFSRGEAWELGPGRVDDPVAADLPGDGECRFRTGAAPAVLGVAAGAVVGDDGERLRPVKTSAISAGVASAALVFALVFRADGGLLNWALHFVG